MHTEFDRLKIDRSNYNYETVEISVLGHYQPSSIQHFVDFSASGDII